jgi:murein DD-endopeptidase MepM/ murein hydrolase activator NlpD
VLSQLRSTLDMAASVLLVLVSFLFIPMTSLVHDLLPGDPVVRLVRSAPTPRCKVPRFTDASLEHALSIGVRGPHKRGAQDQLRLWYHKDRAGRVPGAVDPAPQAEVWGAVRSVMQSRWPVSPRWPLTSAFGERSHPTLGGRRFHSGVDIGVPRGTAVRAALPGVVSRASEDRVNGRHVVLDHGDALASVYCHAERLLVEDGERVEAGQPLALSGSTGRSTGPHLHYGLRIGGTWLDPVLVYQLQAVSRYGTDERALEPAGLAEGMVVE